MSRSKKTTKTTEPKRAPRTEQCSACGQQKPAGQMNGYGECTECAAVKVARQRAASGLASDTGPAADAAIDQAIAALPVTFGLRNHAGSTFRVSRAHSFVSSGVIWLYLEALRDGQWLSALRATPAEIARVIVADPNAPAQPPVVVGRKLSRADHVRAARAERESNTLAAALAERTPRVTPTPAHYRDYECSQCGDPLRGTCVETDSAVYCSTRCALEAPKVGC